MVNNKRVLGIIPARGGSKGLPGKNLKILINKPLIAWSIQAAKNSKYIDYFLVSTDSEEISDTAKKWGADVPFLRPKELATDEAPSSWLIEHAILFLKEKGETFDYVVLIEPTSPLRDSIDIDQALDKIEEKSGEAIVSVCKAETIHPAFMFTINETGQMNTFLPGDDFVVLRRQDLEPVYFTEGSVYISKIDAYLEKKTFYHKGTLAYIVPKWKSIEIDDEIDFHIAETIVKLKGIT